MKRIGTTVALFLMTLPAWAAEQQDASVPDAIEPLSTPYLVLIGLAFIGILAGMGWYYMRWDDEDDRPQAK